MEKIVNRRNVLKSAPIAALPLLIGAAQSNEPDDELVELFQQWETVNRKAEDAIEILVQAEDKARIEQPKRPEFLMMCKGGNYYWMDAPDLGPVSINTTRDIFERDVIGRWRSQCDAISRKYNCDKFERIYDDIVAEREAIEDKIKAIPANSIAGVFIKLRIWERANIDPEPELYDEFVLDAVQAAGKLSELDGRAV